MAHTNLLAPGRIGPVETRNRIVMPAMDQNTCDDGEITDLVIAHYVERAKGGVGLLILETSAVAWPIGATSVHQPALSEDRFITGLARLADAVHAHGAKMFVQMCHHGKTAGVDAIQERPQLVPSVPLPADPQDISAISMDELMRMAAQTGGKTPTQRAATLDDIAWVVDQFTDAAERVQRAGFDGVELHGAHGYLISEFLSPKYNHRDDEYGGSVENRARLVCDIVRSIRARCGDGFAIQVRIDGREYGDGGITPELAAQSATLIEAAGADSIHVSANAPNAMGVGFTDASLPWKPDQYIDLAAAVKSAVSIPVVAVGRIMPDAADAHIGAGICDFVSMGRQLLADPEIPVKLQSGRADRVRTCINCYICVAQNFWDGTPICAINAELGHYDEGPLTRSEVSRRVVVVGGGPGGMEAARVAALRGHRVTLLEKAPHLGGTARFSSLTTPMNAELVRYLSNSIADLDVDVRLSTPVTSDLLRELGAEVVIVATGAKRERPDVPGAASAHVLSGDDLRGMLTGDDPEALRRLPFTKRLVVGAGRALGFLSSMDKVRNWSKRWMPIGKRVVVLGGGLVGVEMAEFLAERGRTVTVVESGDKFGLEMAHPRRARALHEARTHGVEFVSSATLERIDDSSVVIRTGEEQRTIAADVVVLASGVVPDPAIADALRADGFDVRVVGDAGHVGYIDGAVRSGYTTARAI